MAASLDDSRLWLKTHDFCFPTEFPYDAFSPGLSSAETVSSDDDDFLSGLTRRFSQTTIHGTQNPEKQWISGGSPQSTLHGFGLVSSNGSPKGASTPFGLNNDSWEVIYAAAGEVARLKMSNEAAELRTHQGFGLIGPPRSFYSHHPNQLQPNQFHQGHAVKQIASDWGRDVKEQWPTHHHHHQQQQQMLYLRNRGCGNKLSPHTQTQSNGSVIRPMFHAAKRESTGTGVFLPRNPSDYRKKTGCSPVLVPARVVQALNLNFNDMNGQAHQHSGGCVAPNHEALVARRNALLVQQRRSLMAKPELYLPQDWTY